MSLPPVVTRDEWLVARKELLAKEKELTRVRDALNVERRMLPMVEVEKQYVFEGPDGRITLEDMFEGRRQLIVRHFMFHPSWDAGCSGCTAGSDEISEGLLEHLAVRDTTMAHVSRAPLEKIERYKWQRAWSFAWYSSYESDFNLDFGASVEERDGSISENQGVSCFLRDGDRVFHTYATTDRGAEWTGGSYAWLDLTALGRQEDWEEPRGRSEDVRAAVPDFAA
jgi:predicted dithiol-disulfide oxidoreductase (DUF899 family)